jgi:glycosyltransferase involved in cell wall biosynthesis
MTSRQDTIVVAALDNPRATTTWSGTPAHLSLALERAGMTVVQGGPLAAREPLYYGWLRSLYWRLGLGWFLAAVEPRILKQRSLALRRILQNNSASAVISIQADPISAICPSIPTVLLHDCTFASLIDYYKAFTGLSRRSLKLGHQAYQQALSHASLAVFSSEWAANSAMRDYGASSRKVHVLEFGANIENPPTRSEVLSLVESRLSSDHYRFLFLGVDWDRKGGNDAVTFVKSLRKIGVPAHIDVVGCVTPDCPDAKEVCTDHGFLDKNDSRDNLKLKSLLEAASFLLVPSHAECFGCVYCEANAFGVPSIGRETGGIGQIIKENINGFLLANDGRNIQQLAEKVKSHFLDKQKYRKLAISSRDEFEQRLNWDTFVERLLKLIKPNGEDCKDEGALSCKVRS